MNKLKEVFGDTDLVFLNSNSIFKINFSLIKDKSEMIKACFILDVWL